MSRRLAGITAAVALAGLWGTGPALAAGTTWVHQPTPYPASSKYQELLGVSCPSATACVAVGFSGATRGDTPISALAETRTAGGGWTALTAPSPGENGALNAVSCLSASDCTAFGSYGTSTGDLTLAEHWDGTSWSVQPTPNPTGSAGAMLTGGSCSSPTSCTAVGSWSSGVLKSHPLAEQWDGTSWTIEKMPTPPKSQSTTLYGVSCASASHCMAVGEAQYPKYRLAMVAEQWNGAHWFLQTPPSTAPASGSLYGVSCPAVLRCTAVGDVANQSVAEYWDGTTWATQDLPGGTRIPMGVSCRSVTNCTAVGSAGGGAAYWDGTSWVFQPTPYPHGNPETWLTGVSCPTATACTAVGYVNLRHRTNTLAMHR
jgi:hypothetical protein